MTHLYDAWERPCQSGSMRTSMCAGASYSSLLCWPCFARQQALFVKVPYTFTSAPQSALQPATLFTTRFIDFEPTQGVPSCA